MRTLHDVAIFAKDLFQPVRVNVRVKPADKELGVCIGGVSAARLRGSIATPRHPQHRKARGRRVCPKLFGVVAFRPPVVNIVICARNPKSTMAAAASPYLTHGEVEFLAEYELVTITPNFSMDELHFISVCGLAIGCIV